MSDDDDCLWRPEMTPWKTQPNLLLSQRLPLESKIPYKEGLMSPRVEVVVVELLLIDTWHDLVGDDLRRL